jgi:anti-sigma factor RsiW
VEVSVMLGRGYGPDAGDEDLRAHIGECDQCRDRVLLAQSFLDARRRSVEEAPLGNAQALWWKAQLRQRDAALRQVRRPMAVAHLFAMAVMAVVACGFLFSAWSGRAGWLTFLDVGKAVATVRGDLMSYLALFGAGNGALFVFGLGAVALLGGVVYVASDHT